MADVEAPEVEVTQAKKHGRVLGEMLIPPVIAKAIIEVQKELEPLVKSETNDEYGSGFVPLHEVAEKAQALLNKRKIAVMQPVVTDENDHLALTTMLVHESGVGYKATTRLALQKPDPQGHGSAITYARRYNLMSLLGMTAKDDDDDGNKASGVSGKAKPEQIERIKTLLRHLKFPPDQISREIRNIYTTDLATQAIINYEKLVSQRVRDREAEANALEAEKTTHVEVADGSKTERTIAERIKALGLKGKAAENKFIHSMTGKPMLANCAAADLEELSGTLDLLESGKRALPDDWYAAGHAPIRDTAESEKEGDDHQEGQAA